MAPRIKCRFIEVFNTDLKDLWHSFLLRIDGYLQGMLLLMLLLLLLVLLLLLPVEDCALSVTLRSTGCAGGCELFRAALASSSSSLPPHAQPAL